MTTNGGVTNNKANAEPKVDPRCKDMDKRNQENREQVTEAFEGSRTNAGKEVHEKASKAGMTFGSMRANIPAANGGPLRQTWSACSSGKAQERFSDSLKAGGESKQGAGTTTVRLCDGASFKHKQGGYGYHAEARLITEVANATGGNLTGGTLIFKTDWRYTSLRRKKQKKGACQSGMPCRGCYQAMCKATKCGLEIMLCNANNELVPFENPSGKPGCSGKKKKDPAKDGLADLDKRMGEHPLYGIT
jgi:hypothetical protein